MRSPYNYMSCLVSVCKTAAGFVLQGDVSYLTDTRSGSSCGTPISRSSSVSRNPTLTTTRSATLLCSWALQPSCTAVWGIWESARWVQKCLLPVTKLAYAFGKHRWFWCNCANSLQLFRVPNWVEEFICILDVHGSVHHNTNLIEMNNKMQLCRTTYYSIVPWLLNMFRAILSLIIRSF